MIINANKTQCKPVLSAFLVGGDLTQEIVCGCVNVIDQKTLDDFQCYVEANDFLMVSELQNSSYCRTIFIILLFV
tara:strand:+ start:895 stop:1119 length:225 start_codon:yes stop_codon:yes gene_type:complete